MQNIDMQTISFILGIAAVVGVIFTVYKQFHVPQDALEKQQALTEKDVQDKAAVLAQQLQWEKESNERRFKELSDNLTAATALSSNHIAHMDVKVDALITKVNEMHLSITKDISILSTKLEERIPKIK